MLIKNACVIILGLIVSYHCKPPVAIMAPSFSELVSKFWKLVWGRAKGAAKGSCGETVVQKGVFGESVSSLLLKVFQDLFRRFKEKNPKGAEKKTGLSKKTPFWTTVSPHDPFSAPLARPDSFQAKRSTNFPRICTNFPQRI